MLLKMLALIHSGKFQTHQELAAALAVPTGLVLMMAEQLVQKGYLQPLSSCSIDDQAVNSCDSCSSQSGCLLATARQGWFLTERGSVLARSFAS